MKLLTKAIQEKLPPLYTSELLREDEIKVHAKFFHTMSSASWYITEGEEREEDGTWMLYGLCHIHTPELGYVDLEELENANVFGMGIERDLYWEGTLADAWKELEARGVYRLRGPVVNRDVLEVP